MPSTNPFSPVKAELGRYLFHDRRLSGNGTYACASCHQQARAFTDGRTTAIGATGELHRRNSMSLANVVYNSVFNWADSRTTSLEQQALVPMFGRDPIEMGMAGAEDEILAAVAADPDYRRLFPAAFPGEEVPYQMENLVRAIATFERTLVSFDSPFDRYVRQGISTALSPSAVRGMALFFSDRLACAQCHRGFTFAGNARWFGRPPTPLEFHNTGLYNLRRGAYPETDQGRFEKTARRRDMGRFRAPTLRNIALTAPYMHDGSVATLEEVVAHYSAGGRTLHEGPHRGVGRRNRHKSRLVKRFDLNAGQVVDLLTFLRSLTDERFVTDPAFGDPRATAGDR